jgi:hypothetical protein
MKAFTSLLAVGLALTLVGQVPNGPQGRPREDEPLRLPNGKLQSEEILKEDYKKNLKDTQDLIDLAESLKVSLEKNEQHVLSLADIKKTEDIEKLARRIRGRMRRF